MQMPAAARLKLMVAGEEAAKAGDSHLQVVFARQGHDAYVIRPRPVKGGALHQQDFLLQQEVEHHFLVVMNIEAFGVDFREHIQRAFWLHAGDARNIVDKLPGAVALFIQTPARNDKFADALIAAQRRLDSMLGRHVGAQTH